MVIGKGVAREIRRKKESTFDTAAGASGAQVLRRTSLVLNPKKEIYQSDEIRTDYQVADLRHGVRSSDGTLSGELSPGTYDLEMASVCRKDFVAGVNTGSIAVVAVSSGASTFTRSSGSFLTDGFKIGDVLRWTGFANSANNGQNLLIISLTATVMTVESLSGTALVTEAEGASVTGTVVGKKTYIPITGHTDDSFNYEALQNDFTTPDSELYTGVKVAGMNLNFPTTGMCTVDFPLMGASLPVIDTSEYFTSPTATTTSGILASANGSIYISGTKIATLTSMTINVDLGTAAPQAIGSDDVADITQSTAVVTGTVTAYFTDGTLRGNFTDEDEITIFGAFTTSNEIAADFIAVSMTRVKLTSADKNDTKDSIVQTFNYQALLDINGGAGTDTENTTLSIQDSTL